MRNATAKNVLTVFLLAVAALLTAGMACDRRPPGTPAKPGGPTDLAWDDAATYTTVSTDPNRGRIRYMFDWGDGKQETTAYFRSGDTARACHVWGLFGTYPVKTLAEGASGSKSTYWSDTLNVTVDDYRNPYHQPDPPLRPTHVGVDSVSKPIVFWTAATDPDGDSVRIKFYLGDSQPPAYGRWVRSRVAFSDTVVYQTPGWKVVYAVAMDPYGDTSATSAPESVFINLPPSQRNPRP
jgi:hypothetical protein